jgi:hypothetical protein
MHRPRTPEEKQFAKQIEDGIEGEFYREAELQRKADCRLVLQYPGPRQLKSEKLKFETHLSATRDHGTAKDLKAKVLGDVIEKLLSDLPTAENTENGMGIKGESADFLGRFRELRFEIL